MFLSLIVGYFTRPTYAMAVLYVLALAGVSCAVGFMNGYHVRPGDLLLGYILEVPLSAAAFCLGQICAHIYDEKLADQYAYLDAETPVPYGSRSKKR